MTRVMTILPLVAAFALPSAAQQTEWPTFQGDLKAQKYARSTQITPQNVGQLEKAWELHTGDVSDGSGDIPGTVWSATPILANDMLYVGTPFYRILAVRPDTGKVEWTYDPQTELKALTQPELKNRGVAYWQASDGSTGPCSKRVYIGTMDARLHAVDAETGRKLWDFATSSGRY